jgi:hypothetical protein
VVRVVGRSRDDGRDALEGIENVGDELGNLVGGERDGELNLFAWGLREM